jgi:hypothetical protein
MAEFFTALAFGAVANAYLIAAAWFPRERRHSRHGAPTKMGSHRG